MLLSRLTRALPLLRAAWLPMLIGGGCVWSDGNPVLAPPRIVDHIVSALPLAPESLAWSDRVSPTATEAAELGVMREHAEGYRAASARLRDAEAAACNRFADDDRDVSPFFHRRDIVDVLPLRAPGGDHPGRIEGAIIVFRRVEGLTPARLQRLLDCHVARDSALDYAAPEYRWCPLAVPGTLPRVIPTDRGLEVRLAAGEHDAATETYVRAVALRQQAREPAP